MILDQPVMTTLTSLALALSVSPVLAAQIPEPGQADPRVRYVTYSQDDVTLVHVKRGQVTRIVLEDDENIEVAATGMIADCQNPEAFWCIRADVGTNVIWIKPKDGAVRNNLELRTDRRDYSLEFKVQGASVSTATKASHTADATPFRVIFRYPVKLPPLSSFMAATAANSQLDEAAILETRLSSAKPKRKNLSYSMEVAKGSEAIAPAEAFDDGRFTYFRFSPRQDIPTFFTVDASGAEGRVNYHMEGDYVVIQRLGVRFVLRLGRMVVGVWNDGHRDGEGGPDLPTPQRLQA